MNDHTILMIVGQHLLMQVPWVIEGIFDKLMWNKFGPGKDKPWSTWILRPLLFLVVVWIIMNEGVPAFRPAVLVLAYFGLFFPLFINYLLSEKWYYTAKTDNKWTFDYWVGKANPLFYLWVRIWLVILGLCIYHQEMLYPSYWK